GDALRPAADLFEATQSQFAVGVFSSALRACALEVIRISNDLRLLSSGPLTGLAEITLPEVQPGSSMMPGKVNPSILEMVAQTCFSVLGYDQSVAYALQAGQLELNVMMPLMAFSSLEALSILTRSLDVMRVRCIEGIAANKERLQSYFELTPQIATALTPVLGYAKVAELVQLSLQRRCSVVDLVRELKLISERALKRLLGPRT
ncbi:lyase family protein, partial [Bdellovibrionota bacterium FG-2]